ncbi:hypothetical protein FOZ76_21455 [Verticiella sediminum]|uniref:Uncharacterized protein n=1 Tax=Verticiella sediminum TaxID=1247510 RepID=A0A556ABX4_9BURK|nr:hypothetical protein [Verticiella sediminum]TSH90392.1 hypothetical protein FOZ76_21455 [Verticiella sediminum]
MNWLLPDFARHPVYVGGGKGSPLLAWQVAGEALPCCRDIAEDGPDVLLSRVMPFLTQGDNA